MDDILRFLDTNQIIARDVFGEFKISVSSLNPAEIAKEKEKVAAQFKTANDFLGYNFAAKTNITKLFTVGDYLIRKCEPQLFSCSDQESVVRAKLNKYTSEKPNTLHVAIYLAVTEEERRAFENRVKDFSSEFLNSIHIIPDEVLTSEAHTKFIDLIANHNVAKSHYQESIEKESDLAAKQLINKWSNRLVNGSFSLYFNGEQTREGIVGNIYALINKKFSFRVFPKGMEAVKAYRSGVANTFLANKNFPALVLQMLQSPTRDKLVKFSGSDIPAKYIFEENDNHLVDDECKLTSAAITGEAWIAQVCQEVDQCVEDAKKKYVDKFSLSEIFAQLMRPPYGFFPSRANWVAFAYALRKHKADLFVTTISQPISDEKLSEMIVELFKMWNDGHSEASNKLMLRFGSKEESELTQLLYDVFQLQFIKDIPEVKSLSNVRWGINEFCMQKSKYPLWVLTYCDNINASVNEAGSWDPSSTNLTLTVNGEEMTKTWMDWANSLYGVGEYAAADVDLRLDILSQVESKYLDLYYRIPLSAVTSCFLNSYQCSEYTDEYNVMYKFGGIELRTYNYTDAEWAEYVSSQGGILNYE